MTDTLPSGLTQIVPAGFTDNRTTAFDLSDGQIYGDADLGYRPAGGDRRPSGTWSGWTPTTTACATRARSASAASPSSSTWTPTATAWYDDGVDTLRCDDDHRSRRQLSLHGCDGAGPDYIVFVDHALTPAASEYTPTTATSVQLPRRLAAASPT